MGFDLAAGDVRQINTGSIVAFDESVDYDIQMAGGIRAALFGGEGFFLALREAGASHRAKHDVVKNAP